MSVFADSSALVKLYVDEVSHALIRAQVGLIASQLARIEVPAALWRKVRTGDLMPQDAALLVAAFDADYSGVAEEPPRFSSVAVSSSLLDDAARLCAVHGLRAYDSVQLASARAAAAADPECRTVAAFDDQLRVAAAIEGFQLLPA
ncbi:PIN domain-containing protein [Geodermatophilus sp. DF01-2]|uniref:type II toxin-antitoxin system VapC family toxin n=1 Tax=Geodermatophilus sp. DF01-2 TaxID=2559610 RepID=UPI00107424DE|nr:type II toxin-antitoxin system VapC family toxin [Geodermatophilus sp. DF01_2]TFV64695.1 PIN domain-containing protein [Geodermatophilus sp. DF01_2]